MTIPELSIDKFMLASVFGGSVHFQLVLVIEAGGVACVPHYKRVAIKVHSSLATSVRNTDQINGKTTLVNET